MRWNLTKESGRPLHEYQTRWDKEKQESVPIIPRQTEVYCLCKYADDPTPFILIYNLDIDGWRDPDSEYTGSMPFDKVEKWCHLSEIDDILEGKPDPMWCWEFGSTLAETAVPALDRWIEHGVSYVYGMTPEEWNGILKKIRDAFAEARDILDGGLDELSTEEREKKLDEAECRRQEAFSLMAKYYLNMWD